MTSRYFELSGGAGDCINDIYGNSQYAQMQVMRRPDVAVVSCISHNPHIVELFQHWPEGPEIRLRYFGYPDNWQTFRLKNRLPQEPVKQVRKSGTVTFHNHPSDKDALDRLPDEYVVFSVSAGQLERNIPQKITDELLGMGDRLRVVVGRDYERNGWGNHDRSEQLWYGSKIITLINQLSLPATVNVIRDPRCKGVVACFSSMYLVAGWERKPLLLLYPESVRQSHFRRIDQYSLHATRNNNTFHGTFDQWKALAEKFFTHIQ